MRPRLLENADECGFDSALAANGMEQIVAQSAADAVVGLLADGASAAVPMVRDGKYSDSEYIAAHAEVFPKDAPRYVLLAVLENVGVDAAEGSASKSVTAALHPLLANS